MVELKVGIAGYGVVGKRRRLCVERNPSTRLVAVADKTFDSCYRGEDGILRVSNYLHLLEQDLDLLIVCLTNDIAADATIAALECDCHVFCEKPPGRNMEDICKVLKIAETNPQLKLMYGFNHRYHESVRDALTLVKSGNFGKIINIRGVYGKSKLITFNQSDWRTRRELAGGGVLLDQGIHMVDLMRLFAGEFNEFHSFVSNSHWGFDVEDNAYALMKTQHGVVAMLNSSATQWRHRFQLDINLEKGSLNLGGILSGSKSYGAETLTVVESDPDRDRGDPKAQTTYYNHDPSWDDEITAFVDAIIENKPVNFGSADDALNTMRTVFKIYYSDPKWRQKYGITDPDLHIKELKNNE